VQVRAEIGRKEQMKADAPAAGFLPLPDDVRASIPAPSSFTPREIARAAGVPVERVLAEVGRTLASGSVVARTDAVRIVRLLRRGATGTRDASAPGPLFAGSHWESGRSGVPAVVSVCAHTAVIAAIVVATGSGIGTAAMPLEQSAATPQPLRMVYLAIRGPGGGGGGGGLRMERRAPKAMVKGTAKISSPVPRQAPSPVEAPVKRPDPPNLLPSETLPLILAPVVSVPSDDRSRAGVMETSPTAADSRGSGTGGGAGSGSGTGMGAGNGAGIGPGSGGGTGGGPYRPGSGVEPPEIVREVKPTYTELARSRGVTGEVVLDVVVLRDGSVGQVRVVKSLGSGLDERAVEAVRQWRFAPARRLGQPVDVQVEVAVEFRLR
jgi:protein TonB